MTSTLQPPGDEEPDSPDYDNLEEGFEDEHQGRFAAEDESELVEHDPDSEAEGE